ncbi:PhnD/SsuA/transferrin family substrate-binding protein [Rhodoferax sp.]|uniref:PhnD/SsuA/transferrin family substrate-binding protein n=1 Tax=Rhodoferax sp. TaxID=50421 RepID=UPI0039B8F664
MSLALCGLLLLGACGKSAEPPPAVPVMAPALPVRIGVVPALTVTATIRQYQPVVDYLNKKLTINGQLMPQKDYLTVLEKMRHGELDAGIFGSFLGYRAIREIGALPLARTAIGGESTYEGLVFARKDSGIKDIDGLKGKVFAYVDMNTSPIYDAEGKYRYSLHVMQDVTAKREARQAEQALRIDAVAFETQEGILITDRDKHIIRVNRAFTRLTGYSIGVASWPAQADSTQALIAAADAAMYAAKRNSRNRVVRHEPAPGQPVTRE